MENNEETLITVGNLQAETAYNQYTYGSIKGWPSKSQAVNLINHCSSVLRI